FTPLQRAYLRRAEAADPPPPLHAWPAASRGAEMHEPDRLAGSGTARTRNSGNRNREVGRRVGEGALRHGFGGLAADRAETFEPILRHAKHGRLRGIAIGDEAALEHVGPTGDFGPRRSDEAAATGFGGGDLQRLPPAQIEQRTCPIEQLRICHVSRSTSGGSWHFR